MARTNYLSDLMEGQWQNLRRPLPKRAKRGRKLIDRREIINAILSVDRTGCLYRNLREREQWITRNKLARLYHWRQRKHFAPLNRNKRQI